MKASLKGKYEFDSAATATATAAATTLVFPAGDFNLRASMTDATFRKGPSLNGLSLSIEKPRTFIVDYNVPNNDFRFHFMNSVKVLEKPLNMSYIHCYNDNRTMLDGTLVLDSANKVSVSHSLGSRNGKMKYTYVHQGVNTFEPCYDFGKNAWDFALSRKVYDDDVVRASYQTSNKVLGLEWSRNSKTSGCFKVSAVFKMGEESKMPKLLAETTWNLEM